MELLYQHAVKLLVGRPHSKHELQQKLLRVCLRRKNAKRAGLKEAYAEVDCRAVTDRCLDKLAADGLVDDEHFATFWKEQREKYRPRSRMQLLGELRLKGVEDSVVREVMTGYDEIQACAGVALRKPRLLSAMLNPGDLEATAQLSKFLAGRAFSYVVVQQVLDLHRKGVDLHVIAGRKTDFSGLSDEPGASGDDDDGREPAGLR